MIFSSHALSDTRIMEALDVIEDIGSGFGQRLLTAPVHALSLEHAEEAFGRGIVAAVTDRAHAADHVVAA